MNILVYGAGAVGGYLGASLSRRGHQVTLLTRPTSAKLIDNSGLAVFTNEGDFRARPTVETSVRQTFQKDEGYDLILFTMKSYDVAEALNPFIAFSSQPYPPILTLQNGIGIEEMVIEQLGSDNVIAGSLTTPLSREAPERVRVERTDRGLALAPTREGQKIDEWATLFTQAGITTESLKDYRSMKWSKALLNMVGNATSAIVNRHPKVIYQNEPTFELERSMLLETLAVMDALGLRVIDLPGAPAKRLAFAVRRLPVFVARPVLVRVVAGGRGGKMPSFHIDLAAGKTKNEVLYHNGAVAAAGEETGVPTPVNRALNDILLKMARREIDWQRYNGNPGQLVRDVQDYEA